MSAYAELAVTTNFSFLRGASHAAEYVKRAADLGLAAIGIADRNTLSGVVRAHVAAREAGVRLLVGARLVPIEGPEILAYPMDRAAYGRLSRLLSEGKMKQEAAKGECLITLTDILSASEGQILIVIPPETMSIGFADQLKTIATTAPERVFLAARPAYSGRNRERLARLAEIGTFSGAPLIAVNDALYHIPERRPLQDILTCIREHCTIDTAGFHLEANAERHLKSTREMTRLFSGFEPAIARTLSVMEKCRFSLDELAYEYPDEPVPPGSTPQGHLERLAWAGAQWRYPVGVPEAVTAQIEKELVIIAQLEYAPYFLTVHDIVLWARSQGILCQGRGSAANSAVCYCLGITSVDPTITKLLFARFLSRERKEPPDIDVDFEHERREEVIQYVYARYGRERAALTATVISYRSRSAIRDVCKALGLSEDISTALAKGVWGSWSDELPDKRISEAGLDPANPLIRRAVQLSRQLLGFPRHLSQHVGGFVLTRAPLIETVPIGNAAMERRTFIEWDKDDIDALGIMKVDVLALGMLTCIRKAFDLLDAHKGIRHDLASIDNDDTATYDMLCRGDSIGVFQVESRAQMAMLPRLRPREFYDLVIEVAIVRPGPIQGNMVHPYLRRRKGIELVSFPSPSSEHGPPDELQSILERTEGVPLFQEQAMQIAMDAAKFSADEANGLRRAMATFRNVGTIHNYEDMLVGRMIRRGYDPNFARGCFEQIKGFGEYGFPESHAASFALLVYVSSWIKCHHPDVFCAALLNSQPMGFYAPAQIVRDAQEHGVDVRPVDVNYSDWDNTLEPLENDEGKFALRLGFRQVDGISKNDMEILMERRGAGYDTPDTLIRRTCLPRSVLERLAAADSFGSMSLSRRDALWKVRGEAASHVLPLFAAADVAEQSEEAPVSLPPIPPSEHVLQDYQTTRLSLKNHPMHFLRALHESRNILSTKAAISQPNGQRIQTSGVVLVRQRPGTASGTVFITLEDETGVANLVVWPRVMERFRSVVMRARIIHVKGRVQTADNVTHIIAEQLIDCTSELALLSEDHLQDPLKGILARPDEVSRPQTDTRSVKKSRTGGGHPRDTRIIPPSRDFH
ncbi:MAG: error-prone DNA polymerase [Alphaproteobacteria bacterium]|nr:error-prone DNA polymerase [Alphaproteobacteria bacterium]MBU2085125.1 error-prone DNA polymerase [Alphaproteobacteria bacterium]MBU2142055.1 error-prone DNA polymerase [Alphaproteobacteria bacterium]MBU2196947.1 error-prone DNA polymerase [Alphaproteobacteria bacterium]